MADIRLAAGLLLFVSVAVYSLTLRVLTNRSPVVLDITAAIFVSLTAVYVYTVWGQLWIVEWIPLPSVIVLSNWFPPLLAGLAAAVWLRLADAPNRRGVAMGTLLLVAVGSVAYFIPTSPPECGEDWEPSIGNLPMMICRQTTPYTCSAASAATILNSIGIEATEQEMARLCLTRKGTTWLGLYHGLSTKVQGTNHYIEFFDTDAKQIEKFAMVHPVLLCCELSSKAAAMSPEYQTQMGWIPDMPHSVVYLGKFGGRHEIADPARGHESWSDRDLNTVWTGMGLKLAHYQTPFDEETRP